MAVMARYWWAGSLDKRGMHWQSWEKMSVSKFRGGMGFRDLQLFNDAMLAKQAWRLLIKPDSLCAEVLKGRYYPDGDVLQAGCPASSSATWKLYALAGMPLKRDWFEELGMVGLLRFGTTIGYRVLSPSNRLHGYPRLRFKL